jgi:N-acetyl-anhydromuramyl-L-alanine amidase AmpD
MRHAVVSLALLAVGAMPAFAQSKPPVTFIAANPRYHSTGRGGESIRYVVIHTIEGSASSGINTFRNNSRKVSAHYIVNFDGKITQMVRDSDAAWHAGRYNRQSIGIEHAGFSGRNQWTMAQYRASAAITRWACNTYGIPKTRQHIVAHKEVPGSTHGDPGRFFDWGLYMRLVNGDSSATTTEQPDPETSNPDGSTPDGSTPGGSNPGGSNPGGSNPGAGTGTLRVEMLRPARGQVIGSTNVNASGSGLAVEWSAEGRPQTGARVLLEEVGGSLRYNSGYLAGSSETHRVTASLRSGKTYRWKVRVAANGVATVESPWVTFSTDFASGTLTAVSPINAEEVSTTPVLRWTGNARQNSYRVWIDDNNDHSTTAADTKELNGNSTYYYVQGRLQPGKTYYWKVMAFDGNGNRASTAWSSFRTSSTYQHTGGTGLTVVGISPKDNAEIPTGERPTLRWTYHSTEYRDQQAFQVQIDNMTDDGQLLLDQRLTGNHTGYRPERELPAGSYRWRVRVFDGQQSKGTPWLLFTVVQRAPGMSGALDGLGTTGGLEERPAEPEIEQPTPVTATPTPATSANHHVVRNGDTLSEIAARYGTTTSRLASLNGISNPNKIRVGQRLRLP